MIASITRFGSCILLLSFLLTTATGCQRKSEPVSQGSPSQQTVHKRRVALSLPLQIETDGTPILQASAQSHDIRLLVDTGAEYHLLDSQFVASAGLSISKTNVIASGVDGVTTPVGSATVSISSSSNLLVDGSIPIAALPEQIRRRGIAGVLSPQNLAPPGTTLILDFLKGRLAVVEGALTPDDRQGPGKSLAPSGMKVCRSASAKMGGRYLVQGQVAGFDGWLELDTGANTSRIKASSPSGRRIAEQHSAMPVVGQATVGASSTAKLAQDVPIRIGELSGKTDAVLVSGVRDDDACSTIGAIGMDVLRYCIIALDSNGGVARCSPNHGNGS